MSTENKKNEVNRRAYFDDGEQKRLTYGSHKFTSDIQCILRMLKMSDACDNKCNN